MDGQGGRIGASDNAVAHQRIEPTAPRAGEDNWLLHDDERDAGTAWVGDGFVPLVPLADGEVAHAVAAGRVGVTALQADCKFVAGMLVLRQAAARLQPQKRHAIGIARNVETYFVELAQYGSPAHSSPE